MHIMNVHLPTIYYFIIVLIAVHYGEGYGVLCNSVAYCANFERLPHVHTQEV